MAFKIRQNPFYKTIKWLIDWLIDWLTPLGELTTLPRPSSRLGKGHPSHAPPHSAPTHLWRSPCVPQKSSQIYAYKHSAPPQKLRDIALRKIARFSACWVAHLLTSCEVVTAARKGRSGKGQQNYRAPCGAVFVRRWAGNCRKNWKIENQPQWPRLVGDLIIRISYDQRHFQVSSHIVILPNLAVVDVQIARHDG